MANCNECIHLNMTENEQKLFTNPNYLAYHICKMYGTRVRHNSSNPNLYHDYIQPCNKCNGDSFIKRKVGE
jgi:hypothetical protein